MVQFLFSGRVLLYFILSRCIYQIQCCDTPMKITFHLYQTNTINNTLIDFDNSTDTLLRLFTGLKCIKVIIHGWHQDIYSPGIQDILKAYLLTTDCYVIMCNWKYEAMMNYITSSEDAHEVGKRIGDILLRLQSLERCSFNSVHVIGHSLGAHVAGYCGNHVQNRTGGRLKIWRITGLDPASPLFSSLTIKVKGLHSLNKNDATYVDVIHTCGWIIGIFKSIGYMDFYCNGGKHPQPGCNIFGVPCSHQRSCLFFAASIGLVPGHFKAYKCDSKKEFKGGHCDSNPTALMGEYLDFNKSLPGVYYLETTSNAPYAKEWGHE